MIDDLVREPKKKTAFDFVPVIFANGEDDDLPGFEAAVKNERVQYEEKIYEPGERLEIVGKRMAFSCQGLHLLGSHSPFPNDVLPGWVVIREGDPGRKIFIAHCHIKFGLKVS